MSQPSPESSAFEHFLSLLDHDRDRAGARYEDLRRSLIRIFRWRGCRIPEDLADETLGRAMSKTLAQPIEDVARFVHGIARLVVLEDHRRHAREDASVRQANLVRLPPQPADPRLQCLDDCLGMLAAEERHLILAYYSGTGAEKIENRRRLAQSLAVSTMTLRVRAHRVRERLEACLHRCLEAR